MLMIVRIGPVNLDPLFIVHILMCIYKIIFRRSLISGRNIVPPSAHSAPSSFNQLQSPSLKRVLPSFTSRLSTKHQPPQCLNYPSAIKVFSSKESGGSSDIARSRYYKSAKSRGINIPQTSRPPLSKVNSRKKKEERSPHNSNFEIIKNPLTPRQMSKLLAESAKKQQR